MKSALHTEKLATFGPGMPCVYQGQQAVVLSAVSAGERIVRLVSGQQIAVSVDDLQEIARPFQGDVEAESK